MEVNYREKKIINEELNELVREHLVLRCHAGLDPASSFSFWIPVFTEMTPHPE